MYYLSHVKSFPSSTEIEIRFTGKSLITHLVEDGTAVIADEAPATVYVRQYVLATWKGGWKSKYFKCGLMTVIRLGTNCKIFEYFLFSIDFKVRFQDDP